VWKKPIEAAVIIRAFSSAVIFNSSKKLEIALWRIKIPNLCYYVKTVFDKKMANSANSVRLVCSNWHCRLEKKYPAKIDKLA
jgi:hypothetical protein